MISFTLLNIDQPNKPIKLASSSFRQSNNLCRARTIYDPEIPVNIYDLGLIYHVKVEPTADVYVKMTLTSPGCPAAGTLPGEVEDKIVVIPGVKSAKIEVVWEPTWDKEMMSEAAKLQLGFF